MSIHPLAVVDPAAEIHPDAVVGPFCVIKGAVTLAAGVELRNHVTVYGRTTIGTGSVVFPGAVIGGDPQDLKFRGEDSECVVGAGCRIHECATINKGTAGGGMRTVIGDRCLLMAYSHIAHDCVLSEHVIVGNNSQLAGHIQVGRKAIIGGMIGLHHFVTIGELTIIGSMSGVRVDLPPYVMADGIPAEPRGINVIGLRRDGWGEPLIDRMREAYRVLLHDRRRAPLGDVLPGFIDRLPDEGDDPVRRLCIWIKDHLEMSIKGRVQEAHRQPVVGGVRREAVGQRDPA